MREINRRSFLKYAGQLARMKAKMKAFQQETKDPWILKWKYE